ncbi:AMP-binding protein [Ferrovibrio sp.]|uniref:AMP-binding protein n=1 Tax=Ferrovibrio sp. TaxID=1917215 RepID=UPI001B722225|nr:AMP-binding protein [Ferrovibrio sp.]MBP7063623.1 AMP-binding protein [Ferrovibrio sp.]
MGPFAACFSPFEGLNLNWLLAAQAQARREHPFIIFEPFDRPARSISYGEFYDLACQLAQGLRQRGMQPGDRIILHLDNCPEFLLTWCACGIAGAVVVTTNTRCSEEELGYFFEHSGASAAITQPRHAALVQAACRGARWIAVTDNDAGEPAAFAAQPAAAERFDQLLSATAPAPSPPIGPAAPLAVQYTSGTTSRPKAVLWSHANALWAARVSASHEGLLPSDVHHCVLPLFHTNALSYSWLACLWAGATMVLQPRFSASRFWAVALKNRSTWSSITAFCYRALANGEVPRTHHFRNWGVAFSDPLVVNRFNIKPMSWWGMTETLTQGIIGYPHLPVAYGAIGRAAPEYSLRILNAEGQPVQRGETGTIHIAGQRGVSLFQEYYRDPAATAAAFDSEGFFNTGDQVTLLDDGSLRFADRVKDMLKVGGENVAASEIERVIAAIPGVEEVAVVAQAHAMLDEVPVAFVRLGAALADVAHDAVAAMVTAQCRKLLADFKLPRAVYVVQEFPRANVDKIAKAKLKTILAAIGDGPVTAENFVAWPPRSRID